MDGNLVSTGSVQPTLKPIVACYKSSFLFALAGSAGTPADKTDDTQQHAKDETQPSKAVAEVEPFEEITGRVRATWS